MRKDNREYWMAVVEIFAVLRVVVRSLSRVRLFVIPWITAHQASLSITNSQSSPKLMCIESVMAIKPSPPLSSPSPPAPNPSQHQSLFQWVNSSHEVAKVLEFQLQHQSFQWTLRTDWSPLGWTGWISLQSKGLLQHHSSKASILWCSAFFTIQLSHPYMTTEKTIALTSWAFFAAGYWSIYQSKEAQEFHMNRWGP